MENLFVDAKQKPVPGANKFNGDLSKWDLSKVTDMRAMFNSASSFNGDISKWDVSRVTDMEEMFSGASSFAQTLCGAWLTSTADKGGIFDGSSGEICTTTSTSISTMSTAYTTASMFTATSNGKTTSMKRGHPRFVP